MTSVDTIAAISSAVVPAARIILRTSGPEAYAIAKQLCPDAPLASAAAQHVRLRLNDVSVPIWIYSFVAPRSYSGEDVVEYHVPGNVVLARMLLERLIALGARQAEPGEFTARAFFNGRMDLAEAEGVAATIAAHNQQELRAARQLLGGELARRLRPAMDRLAETLSLVEVGIDFSDEDVTFLSVDQVDDRLSDIDATLHRLIEDSARFERLSHEPRVVLVGRPNAGKSTLLNALAGYERAVVSPLAGTTRDAIGAEITLPRGLIRLIDAAGLDESVNRSDPIASQMHEHALREVETADVVLLVHDLTDVRPPLIPPRQPDLLVLTKVDLHPSPRSKGALPVSAMTGENLNALRRRIDELAFGAAAENPSLALNARHLRGIADARAALARARENSAAGAELLAFELRDALDALGQILGVVSPDELLGRIFANFCIGK